MNGILIKLSFMVDLRIDIRPKEMLKIKPKDLSIDEMVGT